MAQIKSNNDAPQEDIDPRFQAILSLVALQKNARHKRKKAELEFLIVNQTFNLIPYRSCVYWEWDGEAVSVRVASGLVELDPHGPYVLWLKNVIERVLKDKVLNRYHAMPEPGHELALSASVEVHPSDCSPDDEEDWKQWASAYALLYILRDHDSDIIGGLWLDREKAFSEVEKAFLDDLSDAYSHALELFNARNKTGRGVRSWRSIFSLSKSNIKRIALVIAIIMLVPVRTSVTAPAEIAARAPYVVSVPFDGVIQSVDVLPGQAVKKGDLLVRMDSTTLRNKSEISMKEKETAEIAYMKTEREALIDKAKLAEIDILKSQVSTKDSEARFAEELLSKADIRAERDGVVIFSDINSLRGRPVSTGQQIMLLSDPEDSELLIRVPVDAMIKINETVPATFFLNATPLGFKKAKYESIGYQASPDPDGLLTYKIRASFDKTDDPPRVGWTGTGKVYGDRTILAFNILRRPLVTLRRKLGL